jgi:hypothetical protein
MHLVVVLLAFLVLNCSLFTLLCRAFRHARHSQRAGFLDHERDRSRVSPHLFSYKPLPTTIV